MAEKDTAAAPAPAEKPKITLLFFKEHEHHTFKKNDKGEEVEVVKNYRPGDRDVFTQSDADLIRALRVAQTVANPKPLT